MRVTKYNEKGNSVNQGLKDKSMYEKFMKPYFEKLDYYNNDHLLSAVSDIV